MAPHVGADAIQGIRDPYRESLGHALANFVGRESLNGGCFTRRTLGAGCWLAAEDQGHDAKVHVLVDARELADVDLDASFSRTSRTTPVCGSSWSSRTPPLASRPYDLWHSALSTWLNSGVDATEVAERAVNSVEVLLSRYASCIDRRQENANRKIEGSIRQYEQIRASITSPSVRKGSGASWCLGRV